MPGLGPGIHEFARAGLTLASSDPTAAVQWQLSTDHGGTFRNLPGATASTLILDDVRRFQNGYQYRALLSNVAGTVTSNPATLTVNAAPAITSQPEPSGHRLDAR